MKKMLSILIVLSFVFSNSSVMAEEKIEVKMGVTGGQLTIDLPEVSTFEKINDSTYKVSFTDMKIQDFQGKETDYKVKVSLNVYDKNGTTKSEPYLSSNVSVEGNQNSFPAFHSIKLSSGTTQTLISNNFKTFFSNSTYTYENAILTNIEEGDQVKITFQISK